MADMTLDDVYRAARQLPREEQDELIRRLRVERHELQKGSIEDIPVLNIISWPEDWPPRREDLYDDEHRAGLR